MALERKALLLEGKYGTREKLFLRELCLSYGSHDSRRARFCPHSSQSPDCSDNKDWLLQTLRRHNFETDIYNGVLTMGTVSNVFEFPWRFMAKRPWINGNWR